MSCAAGAQASPLQCISLADSCLALGAASCQQAIKASLSPETSLACMCSCRQLHSLEAIHSISSHDMAIAAVGISMLLKVACVHDVIVRQVGRLMAG